MLPSSVLRPKRQMCFNKSRQYEEKSFHFSLQIPVTAHLFHFPCLLCAVSRREKTLSNWAPRTRRGLENSNNSTLLASCRRRLARTARTGSGCSGEIPNAIPLHSFPLRPLQRHLTSALLSGQHPSSPGDKRKRHNSYKHAERTAGISKSLNPLELFEAGKDFRLDHTGWGKIKKLVATLE